MATQAELMAAGLPPGLATQLGSSINTAVTATGSNQGGAAALTATYSVVTAGSGAGVILPAAGGQPEFAVHNVSGGNVTVYPAAGQTVYGGSNTTVNVGFVVATNKTCFFDPVGTAWVASLSA